MTKEQLAETLNGRQYRNEMSQIEEQQAKENGLVVAFGASDDLIEFRGAIYDEYGAGDEDVILFTKGGKFISEEHIEAIDLLETDLELDIKSKIPINRIETIWSEETADGVECSWQYKTDIPHATFDVREDGELYCRGIVFSLEDLK